MAPTVQSHDLDGASLTLVFSEALDEGSVPAASAFGVKVVGEDATETRSRALTGSRSTADTVTLTLATAPADTAAVTLQYTPPSANPLRDPRSNEVEAFGPEEVGYEGPRVVFAKVVGATLTIGYNEALDSGFEAGEPRAFAVTVDGTPRTVSNVAISGSDVTLTLASAVTRGQPVQLAYTVPTNNPLRDTDGNEARDIAEREVDNDTLSAPGAPRNLRAAAGNTEVTLTWAPPADNGGTPITGYDVRWAGNATAVPSATSWRSVGPGLRYVVTGLVNDRPYAFEVSAVSAEGRGEAADATATPIEADLTPPALSSARVENGTLDLTYNEPLDANAVPAASAFTVREDGSGLRVSTVRVSGARVILTLSSEADPGTAVTVSYAAPSGSGALRDRSGNRAPAFSNESARNASRWTMRLSSPGTVDEGVPFTFTVTRNGGEAEETFVVVTVTDSAFPGTPAGAYVRNNGPGGRIVEFDPGDTAATGTMTPAFDGARPGSRTLRVKLETAHVDLGESNGERNYRVAGSDTLTPRVRDRDAALRVADARVREGPDAKLEFRVTLDRGLPGSMEVDYATSDGTATAGQDYTDTSGTLTFAAGTTSQTVSVPVLDDVHNDGGETLTFTLSNARVAFIEDATATGTILNTDLMPKAWLARFGRTGAAQVVDLLNARFDEAAGVPNQLTLGGRDVYLPSRRTRESSNLPVPHKQELSEATGGGASVFDRPPDEARRGDGVRLDDEAGTFGQPQAPGTDVNAVPEPADGANATLLERALWTLLSNRGSLQFDQRQFLSQSRFDLSLTRLLNQGTALNAGPDGAGAIETVKAAPDTPGHWSLWGRGALTHFNGADDGVNIGGAVLTGLLGVDYARAALAGRCGAGLPRREGAL